MGSGSKGAPDWALEPAAAWGYLVVAVVLASTPAAALILVLLVLATVFTYLDRSAHGFPAFWWTVGVFVFGPLAYLAFVYKRPRGPVIYSPEAAVSQQARLVRGLPPQAPEPTPVSGAASADWYPDPKGEARLRYWDGAAWTDRTEL
ncbi:MAG TPA: DUF2510 domain-containing protein [Solirubrobacterales bacterium]|nr:DUF2510 domain-containing protein [Solirubrobacterales bacterium]